MLQAAEGNGSSAVVQQVVASQVHQLLGPDSVQQYNETYINCHSATSLRHTAAAAEMLLVLQPQDKQRAVGLLLESQALSDQPGKGYGA